MSDTPLRDELDRLQGEVEQAEQHARETQRARDEDEQLLHKELIAPWNNFGASNRALDGLVSIEENVEHTEVLLDQIHSHGLALRLDPGDPALMRLVLFTPEVWLEHANAHQRLRDAESAFARFEFEHRSELAEEADRAQAEKLREAIASAQSVGAIREALA